MDRKRENKIDVLYDEYEIINALADLFWPEILGTVDMAVDSAKEVPSNPKVHNQKRLDNLWYNEIYKLIEVENMLADVKKFIEERVGEYKTWAKEKKSEIEGLIDDGRELIINGESFLGYRRIENE